MFKRKPKAVVKVEPAVPRFISLEHAAEAQANNAAIMMDEIRRYRDGNIRICSDLMKMQQRLDRAKAAMLKSAMEYADEMDFASSQITQMIQCLQGDEQDLQPATSQAALTDETKSNGVSDMAVIGFLPPGARP